MEGKIDIRGFYDILDGLYERKEMNQVEPYLLKMLLRAGNLKDLEGVISVCNELGGLYRAMRRTDKALWTYEKVMEGLERMGLKGTHSYAAALINLGNVYIVRRDYMKAYDIDRQALKILERLGGGRYQTAALYNNMSAALRELGRTKEAQDTALCAIEMIRELPECMGELAASYINLGQAQAKEYLFSDARRNLMHALQLYENGSGDSDIHYANALCALANLDDAQGYYRDAEERYIRALKLIERDFGHTSDYDRIMEELQRIRRKEKKDEGNGTVSEFL